MQVVDSGTGVGGLAKTHGNGPAFYFKSLYRPAEKIGDRRPVAECQRSQVFFMALANDEKMMLGIRVYIEILGNQPAVVALQNGLGVPAHGFGAKRTYSFLCNLFERGKVMRAAFSARDIHHFF